MAKGTENRVFGKRAQKHVLILASGEKIRHMTIRPWMAALTFCFIAVFAIGYIGATSYLVIRDDLIGATMARQARMQHDYEDRISALRAQLDRITSRQLLDQQVVEQKVEKLLEQQNALFDRHGKLGSLLNRAEESGITAPDGPTPMAAPVPERQASVSGGNGGLKTIQKMLTGDNSATATEPAAADTLAYAPLRENIADRADRVFSRVTLSLKNIEKQQIAKIANLTSGAAQTADAITDIMKGTGVEVASAGKQPAGGIGGPYMPPLTGVKAFDASLDGLDAALSRLEKVRETAREMPFGNPAPGHEITSRYGNRIDPFLGKLALHAGIDFQAETGQDVKATGAGKITIAGPVTGYGNMVEIDHGRGITTRYGHMSRIIVKEGDTVAAGDVIGRAGSTGRSTGPHIHYEVRRDGTPIDPIHFLNAGMKLTTYLN